MSSVNPETYSGVNQNIRYEKASVALFQEKKEKRAISTQYIIIIGDSLAVIFPFILHSPAFLPREHEESCHVRNTEYYVITVSNLNVHTE